MKADEYFFGTSITNLKRKTTRRKKYQLCVNVDLVLTAIMKQYQNVTLGGYIMYINKIQLFVTITEHIMFGTADMISSVEKVTLVQQVRNIIHVYKKWGFIIHIIGKDGKFEPLRGNINKMDIDLNVFSDD